MATGKREKVGQDLRKVVKQMSPHPIFSQKWFHMLGSLQHITDVAVIEHKHRAGDGSENPDDSTLWERNELIVRYMLEEGKLNLTLRLLTDFKTMQRNEQFADALKKAQATEPNAEWDNLATIKIKAALFEQSLGMLLSCALASVESLQTLDMPCLIEHMGHTLKFALSHSEMVKSPDSDRRQEILCLVYLNYVFDKMEHLQEDRIMELLQEHGILGLMITNLSKYHELYSTDTKMKASKALSGFLGSEAFATTPDAYITNDEQKKMLVDLEGQYVKEMFSEYSLKKQIRPLLDAITKFKYQIKG